MSSADDVDRVLAVVSDLKHTTKKLDALHELDVKMAMEFFEKSPPSGSALDDAAAKPLSSDSKLSILR